MDVSRLVLNVVGAKWRDLFGRCSFVKSLSGV